MGRFDFFMGHMAFCHGAFRFAHGADSCRQWGKLDLPISSDHLPSAEYLVERCELAVLLDRTASSVSAKSESGTAILDFGTDTLFAHQCAAKPTRLCPSSRRQRVCPHKIRVNQSPTKEKTITPITNLRRLRKTRRLPLPPPLPAFDLHLRERAHRRLPDQRRQLCAAQHPHPSLISHISSFRFDYHYTI